MNQGKHMTDDEIIEANCRQNFAAARGARLRIFVAETRIHPDDEYLQYGPISTALRDMAEQYTYAKCWQDQIADAVADEFTDHYTLRDCEPDYPLFYLILAEFLADEGM